MEDPFWGDDFLLHFDSDQNLKVVDFIPQAVSNVPRPFVLSIRVFFKYCHVELTNSSVSPGKEVLRQVENRSSVIHVVIGSA